MSPDQKELSEILRYEKDLNSSRSALPPSHHTDQNVEECDMVDTFFEKIQETPLQQIIAFAGDNINSQLMRRVDQLYQERNSKATAFKECLSKQFHKIKLAQAFVFKSRLLALWIFSYLQMNQITYDKYQSLITFDRVYCWIYDYFSSQHFKFSKLEVNKFKLFLEKHLVGIKLPQADNIQIPQDENSYLRLKELWEENIKTPTGPHNLYHTLHNMRFWKGNLPTAYGILQDYCENIKSGLKIATSCFKDFAEGKSLLLLLDIERDSFKNSQELLFPAVCVNTVYKLPLLPSETQSNLKKGFLKLTAFINTLKQQKNISQQSLLVSSEEKDRFQNTQEIKDFFQSIKVFLINKDCTETKKTLSKLDEAVQFAQRNFFFQGVPGFTNYAKALSTHPEASPFLRAFCLSTNLFDRKEDEQANFNCYAFQEVKTFDPNTLINGEESSNRFFKNIYKGITNNNALRNKSEKKISQFPEFSSWMTENLVMIWVLAWDPQCALRFFQGDTGALDDYHRQFKGYWQEMTKPSWFSRHKNTLIGFILGLIFAGSAIGLALSQHYKWSDFGDKKDLPFKIIFFILVGLAVIAWVYSVYIYRYENAQPESSPLDINETTPLISST